jgi:ubiquinone/menaquinone biosynthesis C-methylase UbiE
MNMLTTIKGLLQNKTSSLTEKPVVEAYDAWSASYDYQPGNLMLDLDEELFADLIKNIDLKNKRVADIGCGTGRHWQKIYSLLPRLVMGFDVSEGMLKQLKQKFPQALTQHTQDDHLTMAPNEFVDCIITTLTIAHIKNIDEAIAAWSRVIKKGGDLIITDFHPSLLAKGGKRSFKLGSKSVSVINYVHTVKKVKKSFAKQGFTVVKEEEKFIDEDVKHYYEAQNALPVYERFKGMPVIYGLHLKKEHAAE